MTEPYRLESGKVNPKSMGYKLGDLHIRIQNIESDIHDIRKIVTELYWETVDERGHHDI